ncbi:hypothetical protein AOT93_03520 [Mycobacteroides sp. H110]|nr:hypothetical protein AOT87_04380 [Mycobacteroides sp. H003]KRQ32583.1 hypothetical protein AOT91_11480 [Mycobacteroides sp. H092]KRQ42591.1 hypothetical protein AOT88_25625 [Mycobacteroides sp. H063]KRQ43788.1 hypothetical protein AOT92_07855 [Mycobacteroides sp. H101]KRQ54831.1 hypothetical protein AOT94_22890 [Mycobacteroides sp. HXVII]KRQ62375.1 hypothetical protein AOT90_15320 [Mycobacteroides sp. H079]KRQ79102.1 hypothetical protein AOT95_18780 [Mycobacteroides sp. HXXIII]KRQ84987.1 
MLEAPTAEEKRYTPETTFDGSAGHIQTGTMKAADPVDYTDLLKQFGYDPDEVQIVGSVRTSRWQQREDGEWLVAYRFNIAPRQTISTLDLEALVKKAKTHKPVGAKGHWLVFQAADLQLGKRSRDGSTEQIVENYLDSLQRSIEQYRVLKRYGIEGIQVSMPGDCIEGVVSQSGRNLWLTQETITEQTRILRRLMVATVDAFRPLVDQVYLDVVNGNHDQSQRQQNTYPGDGWATECAIAVHDALQLNPAAYGHVSVRTPDRWSNSMTVPVGSSVVTVTHGDAWRRGKGMLWWSGQTFTCQPAGAAQVLQHGHWHGLDIEKDGDRTRLCCPALDCGSDWYRNLSGSESRPGALTYLLDHGQFSHLSVV